MLYLAAAERMGSSEPERGMSKLAATIISGLLTIGWSYRTVRPNVRGTGSAGISAI